MREVEQSPAEILGRSLLLLPAFPISDAWAGELDAPDALALLEDAETTVHRPFDAFRRRLERGDVLGAEMMVASGLVGPDPGLLRQARDRWKAEAKREIAECRRLVEVGSTYGYLQDADRGQIESKLSKWEAHLEEMRRFDLTLASIKAHRDQIEAVRDAKKAEVRVGLAAIPLTEANRGASEDIERALDDGDVTRAHELLHWLEQGKPTPAELNEPDGEGFGNFFPLTLTKIEAWLQSNTRRDQIEFAIRKGALASHADSYVHDSAAREMSAKIYGAWADMKGQQSAVEQRLSTLLTGLGFTVRELQRAERVSGREIWNFDAGVIDDRNLCALPTYGSFANGRYRVICVWGRPTEDEFLNWVGDASNSRPAIILYFGRQSERKWRELSRLAKTRRRSFVFLDETLLFYLFTVSGSRLAAWFDSALPFAYTSPYDATAGLVPPEMFYGRSAELDAVFGLNGRCFIYGGRQLGKTALLKRAEQSFHRPRSGNFSKWIDLRAEGIGVSLAASEIWLTLYEKLRELGVLDSRSLAPTPGKKQGVEVVIKGIRDFLSQDGDRRILLLMDEADRFFEQDGRNDFEETRKIKQLMDDTQRRFKVVFAGLHNVLRMTERPNHPLAHFGEPIEIGPLREGIEVREAADLIQKPMAAAGFAFESKGLVIRILAQTNYYPSLIQLYCSHLLRHALGQVASKARAGGPRYVLDDRDIEQVYSSEALRDEIRAKFRLTLQLDPKYEVLAYAMALDLLRGNYAQAEGQSWQFIRQAGALHWWADGFRDTSELDFRVLLDEMVGLGVLRRLSSGNYALRNPNVLLLLGTQEEIETVLNKEREPVVEFEGATFRPPLRQNPSSPRRNVFSYQQLSRLLQRSNEVAIVAGTSAAGIDQVYSSLADYLGSGAAPVLFASCNDAAAFGRELQTALSDRPKDQVSVFVIPHTAPWTDRWIDEAKAKLRGLRSVNKFVSVVFVADPATLWRQLNDHEEGDEADLPWISLLHWSDGFLRHWLEEQQLQLDADDRTRLSGATGLWPGLIIDLAGECREVRKLREKIVEAEAWSSNSSSSMQSWDANFGLDIGVPAQILDILAQFKEPVLAADLVIMTETEEHIVDLALRWGELLGITRREGAGYWTVDPFVSKVLGSGSL
ncbi:AAA family ATPase [Xanthomonas campestris pv. raphani]|uniref:AAA family ATPase n=1 Tax=Xanthomonas campestris TaxID=339 RepID=UPI002B22AD0A|nr:AAA family ATPase [Xanthomonas campestris]MEA9753337.1 AAA family ATPase [Xanthomonas campestris pv. raphani]MEA9813609.1 AAA family ATPase [Xanthomonas campestris pv. raphani]